MSSLTVVSQAVAFDDGGSNSNPVQTPVNWARTLSNLPVDNPGTQKFQVAALSTLSVFSGARSTSIDGTSAFSLAVSTYDSNRYRVTNTGGTAPAFRTARAVNCSAIALTLVVNSNLSVTVTAGSGTPFTAVQVGDTVFIPGTSTGDVAGLFSALNEGFWIVLSKTSTVLVLTRFSGQVFSGLSEVVTPASAAQFQTFSADGVQIGDTAELASGFATTSLHSYAVLVATPSWFEFESTSPLGVETGILPTATGLIFYTSSKRWLRIETDQEINIRLNGDTSNSVRVEPAIPGDKSFRGWFEMFGSIWSLTVVNRSTSVLNLFVLSAE